MSGPYGPSGDWMHEDRVPIGRVVAFPDLSRITPAPRGNRYARAHARLAAFYESITEQLGRTAPLSVAGVWVSPSDWERLRAWVEWPLRYVPADVRRRTLAWLWLDSSPSISRHVADGQVVVTSDADGERQP